MSKCDLEIRFDRAERRYRPGDEITGTVSVQVNEDVECNGILLEHFWQTHGRGNVATGPKATSTLHRGPLRAGELLSFPFRFMAPSGPPTYHGRYLNVDHYVHVRVDVPWAIDPKLKEEYLLVPGEAEWGNLPGPLARKQATGCGIPVGAALIIFGLSSLTFFPCLLILVPIGLIVIFVGLRKTLAEKRIGTVRLRHGLLTVAPGGNLPLRLSFTPRKSSKLNRITAELVGMERCVSGSGTNKSTHVHKFHERTVELLPQCELTAGQTVDIATLIPIPQTDAFTFHAPDNDIAWELGVRIDIPAWPDWVEKHPVIVRPAVAAELVEEAADVATAEKPPVGPWTLAPFGAGARQPAHDAESPFLAPPERRADAPTAPAPFGPAAPLAAEREEPLAAEPSRASAEASDLVSPARLGPPLPSEAAGRAQRTVEAPAPQFAMERAIEPSTDAEPATSMPFTDPALVAIVGRIVSADRYSRDREQIIEQNSENAFACAIEVAKAERTYSYIPDQRFRKGRTVIGKIHGTGCEVAVQLAEARNREIDALGPGDLLQARCRPLKWNTIYDRLEMREE